MNNLFYFLALAVFICGCGANSVQETEVQLSNGDDEMFDAYVKDFKISTFNRCLRFGFNESNNVVSLLKRDISAKNDFPLGLPNYRYIDALARQIGLDIKADSTRLMMDIGRENIEASTDLIGNRTLLFCLNYYTSHELDSIAVSRIKKLPHLFMN